MTTGTQARRIFITGGASGLGRALAERYAKAGYRVAIGDVSEARGEEVLRLLERTAPDAASFRCDVREEQDLERVADALEERWGGVDIVVNNAGVAVGGGIAEVPLADWQWILDINLLGVVRGCRVFTPRFRAQGGGRFVNVASMAGLIHPPRMAAYCAAKAAVVALSETLRFELAGDGIEVTVVCPSFFRTNLAESLRAPDEETVRATRELVNGARLGAEEIAERVYRGVERGDFHVLPHGDGKAAWLFKRLVPFALYRGVVGLVTKRDE